MSKDLRTSLHETAHILHDIQSDVAASGFDFDMFEQRAYELEGLANRLQSDFNKQLAKVLK